MNHCFLFVYSSPSPSSVNMVTDAIPMFWWLLLLLYVLGKSLINIKLHYHNKLINMFCNPCLVCHHSWNISNSTSINPLVDKYAGNCRLGLSDNSHLRLLQTQDISRVNMNTTNSMKRTASAISEERLTNALKVNLIHGDSLIYSWPFSTLEKTDFFSGRGFPIARKIVMW